MAALWYLSDQNKSKTHQIPKTIPTQNTNVTFDPPSGQVMADFFKLSVYHVVNQSSKLEHSKLVLRPFEIFSNLGLNPLLAQIF